MSPPSGASAAGKQSTAGGGDDEGEKDTAYFQYYALLSHQAQMLQDAVRTSAYQKAILANAEQCFREKVVIDVGAGNGILSIFSAQAGARKVYAIEASDMVENLRHFMNASKADRKPDRDVIKNAWLGDRVLPVHSKMEDVMPAMIDGGGKCDTVVSECLGVLLVHERMCESFLDARDRFLKSGGAVLPSAGVICLAPFEDKLVWEEAANKARFWDNKNFYGIDVTPFSDAAWQEVFSSPVVGCFGPLILLATANNYNVDFLTISKEELRRFTIPLSFDVSHTAVVHGLAGWFDLHFLPPSMQANLGETLTMEEITASMMTEQELDMRMAGANNGSEVTIDLGVRLPPSTSSDPLQAAASQADPSISSSYMTTSPYATPTHWQQVRFLFQEPLAINKGQRLVGEILCEVNDFRSYTLTGTIKIHDTNDELLTRRCCWRLDRQVYSWTSASPSTQ